ncbi:MAG TPA: GWxTD domain-containing protein [Gemmatimonadales bacterium]|nr:GWxTD domain-containing protein [Gemmatimonadales bacterium]
MSIGLGDRSGANAGPLARSPVGILFLLALYLSPLTAHFSPLIAQSTAFESSFQSFRDSLSPITNTSALQALFKSLRRSEPLRAGAVALRLAQLGINPSYDQAISSFRLATKAQFDRPEPWYGLGAAEWGRSQWEMRDKLRLGSRVGLGQLERSADDFARALAVNIHFLPAALALAEVDLMLMEPRRLGLARDLLRRVTTTLKPPPPELFLALGRVERAAGSLEPAAAAFERYLVRGRRALGLLELARTRLALGRADGEPIYYEAAALDDPVANAEYRADLKLIADDSVLHEFDQLDGAGRAAFLHRFWMDRDHVELRPEGERLREHYRRIWYARSHFPLTISRRFYGPQDAYRSGNNELDDRGVIYIRHGSPNRRLRPFIFGAMPNESWLYLRADGNLVFHFSAGYDAKGGGDLYDYRLVQSVLDLRGAEDAPRDQLILSRQSLSPLYSRMLNWGNYGSAKAGDLERSTGAADIVLGTATDSYELQFASRLEAVGDLVAVGHRADDRLAHFVFGIAAPGTSGQPISGRMAYPVRIRLVALDRRNRAVASLDTALILSLPRQLRPTEWLVGRAELTVPPGRWTYRAAIQQGDSAGVILPRDSVLVSRADQLSLGLSDIALGARGRAVRWITDVGDTVLLAPSRLLRQPGEVQIYYEVSGARRGSIYRHQITVLQANRPAEEAKRRPMVSLYFDERAAGDLIRSHRSIQLDQLKPGGYFVEVKVTAPDGSSQERRRWFQLIPTR